MRNTGLRPWRTLSSRDIVEHRPWLKLTSQSVELPNGVRIDEFYRVHLPDYSVIAAFTDNEMIVMEKQYKHAVGRVILNLPAGYIDAGESPLRCAKRELFEETGFRARKWRCLGRFCVDGNRGCGVIHSFAAFGAFRCDSRRRRDRTEDIEVVLNKPSEAMAQLAEGEVVTAGSAMTLALALLAQRSPRREVHKKNVICQVRV